VPPQHARPVSEFGYLKDFPEILHRIIHGGVSTRTPGKKARLIESGGFVARFRGRWLARLKGTRKRQSEVIRKGERKARIAAANARDQKISVDAAVERRKRRADAAARAVDRYARDPTYWFLHDRTADLFADLLARDMQKLADGKLNELSLAEKWCPSLESCYDRSTLLCEGIARRLFPKGSAPVLPDDLEDEYYAYRVRDHLRKTLVSLRRALQLPEIFMSAGAWGDVVYKRVASVAMTNYKDFFIQRDQQRFQQYLADVKSGKEKIAAGAVLPHEILASVEYADDEDIKVANLQWQRMVSDLRELGKLSNYIVICGVCPAACLASPWTSPLLLASSSQSLAMSRGTTGSPPSACGLNCT
jgi:hypothetical protein